MAQLFTRTASNAFRVLIVLTLFSVVGAGVLGYAWSRADATWNVGKPADQPVPFRHDLHAGSLGIDCRYCHSTVERAADAGMPSAQTCMTCHSQVWVGASVLEPVRSSFALGQPLTWTSVHRLPDFAYFNHAAHVTNGVACETCHGRVDQMTKTVKTQTLSMGWCLDCHRDPAPHLRPREAVFVMGYKPHGQDLPEDIQAFYREASRRLTSCNTCHR
ncbi:cytochrome c3 family protein [Microvirga lenta]|uniref:cytochrome c3 family protein n=1 Tax=Microvirga lenta TaxID=2881337 RepID=UPI001D0010CE|nr:cytochrome c3 family protein [Microvirga lenta]MCB5175717.1 cytochrome C [Microvirga lenta]